ncbi:MAG: oligopeptide/dipeptide ABC transporter ATP-binding protein, partial [Alphaproteobacteria bacterium]
VADEAVSKLDVSVRAQILNLLKDLQAAFGLTILFITHDLRVARYLCHRIGVMYFGKLVEIGPADRIYREPKHPYTKALIGTLEDEMREGESALAGEAFNPTGETVGCRFYSRCPIRKPNCAERHPPMDEAAPGHEVACYEWRGA